MGETFLLQLAENPENLAAYIAWCQHNNVLGCKVVAAIALIGAATISICTWIDAWKYRRPR